MGITGGDAMQLWQWPWPPQWPRPCPLLIDAFNSFATTFCPADCGPTPDFYPRPGSVANARIQDLPGILRVSALKSIQAFWVRMPWCPG